MMDHDFNIIIVGGVGAGLLAEILACEAGATVMVLEATPNNIEKSFGGRQWL